MKYFIAKYRVSQDALDVLFGALKKAEHEGIEFLECTEDFAPSDSDSKPVRRRKPIHRNGGTIWDNAEAYYDDFASYMEPSKSYEADHLAKVVNIRNKFKNKGREMTYDSKRTLISKLVSRGKLVIVKDGLLRLNPGE